MSSQIEDHALDEGYWRTLLQDVDRTPSCSFLYTPPLYPPALWEHEPTCYVANVDQRSEEDMLALKRMVKPLTTQDLLMQLCVGDIRLGRVNKVTAFGAFVDLGGYDGLLRVSELSWRRIDHPRDAVMLNQHVQVYVMSVDTQTQRVALSLKRTKPDPWVGIEQRYKPGQVVSGLVANIVDYGAFVQVEEDLEGLIHASELGEGNFLHPRSVLKFGERVHAYVLSADAMTRRLALTLKFTLKSFLSVSIPLPIYL